MINTRSAGHLSHYHAHKPEPRATFSLMVTLNMCCMHSMLRCVWYFGSASSPCRARRTCMPQLQYTYTQSNNVESQSLRLPLSHWGMHSRTLCPRVISHLFRPRQSVECQALAVEINASQTRLQAAPTDSSVMRFFPANTRRTLRGAGPVEQIKCLSP